jgi:hypothetical protein
MDNVKNLNKVVVISIVMKMRIVPVVHLIVAIVVEMEHVNL